MKLFSLFKNIFAAIFSNVFLNGELQSLIWQGSAKNFRMQNGFHKSLRDVTDGKIW